MGRTQWRGVAALEGWLRRHLTPGRHTTYFEVLDALEQEGCPICRLVLRAVARYLDILSHEGVNDPGVRARLRAARGFCNHHTWQFAQDVRNAAGRAMIYRDILGLSLRTLEAPPSALLAHASGPGALADRLLPVSGCPVCDSQAHALRRYLDTLLLYLGDAELRRRYLASNGLCLPHLRLALQGVRRPAEVELLAGVATRWAATLGVASRLGLHGHTLAIVAGVVGKPGAVLPGPLSGDPDGDIELPAVTGTAERAAHGDDCPVCREATAVAAEYLIFLSAIARAREPATPPASGLSLCNIHAWRLVDRVPPGAAARLWQPAARAVRAALGSVLNSAPLPAPGGGLWTLPGRGAAAGWGAAVARQLELQGDCVACRAQALVEERAALALLAALRAQEAAAAEQAGQLCLPHCALSLRLATGARQRQVLAAQQAAHLQALRTELDEYLRKQNFRCREPRGPEADSPWRAMARAAGAGELGVEALAWRWRPPAKG